MVRLFSTWALGLLVICLGSVMADGAGRIWARVIVLIAMTIANRMKVRMRSFEMWAADGTTHEKKFSRGGADSLHVQSLARPKPRVGRRLWELTLTKLTRVLPGWKVNHFWRIKVSCDGTRRFSLPCGHNRNLGA